MTPFSELDHRMMRIAIALAMKGRGRVEPNPMVGCVIAGDDGRIIGEGFHARFGGPHAEPSALATCTRPPAGATAYVTLEPCCHTDKKTPPCVPSLVEAKLGRIVVGCIDPHPLVSGGGIERLRKAGITVDTGLLEDECKQLIAPFIARAELERPYVTLKSAQSSDGKVAGPGGQRRQISNALSQRLVHELRARSDVILVGINTVLADDPLLTARNVETTRPLIRAVLDTHLRIPLDCRLVQPSDDPMIVFCARETARQHRNKVAELEARGVLVYRLPTTEGRVSLVDVIKMFRTRSWLDGFLGLTQHLLVEPGPTLARSFLSTGLADRIWIFRSPISIDDPTAPSAPEVNWPSTGELGIGDDVLGEYLNPRGEALFANVESADLILARASVQACGDAAKMRGG